MVYTKICSVVRVNNASGSVIVLERQLAVKVSSSQSQ